MNDSTLPGCIGYYGKPTATNKCELCRHADVCKKLVAKDCLKKIFMEIEETEKILRGEK